MRAAGRLEPSEHGALPWRISEVVADFDLIDAWAFPVEGSADEFDDLCDAFGALAVSGDGSPASRLLFATRTRLGELLGWDDDVNTLPIPGCTETSVRDRLPADLDAETAETAGDLPFRPVYRTEDEWAMELSNSTVHAVVHLGWAPVGDDRYRGQMGIYVKPRGRLGRPYMTFIAPFRHHVVYPALLKRVSAAWETRSPRSSRRGC